ncbi:MAG: hypothetical protein N2C14_11845, partial [Planctomycetales bacterium]
MTRSRLQQATLAAMIAVGMIFSAGSFVQGQTEPNARRRTAGTTYSHYPSAASSLTQYYSHPAMANDIRARVHGLSFSRFSPYNGTTFSREQRYFGDVFEPWPFVPGDIYGWPYDQRVQNPVGHSITPTASGGYVY